MNGLISKHDARTLLDQGALVVDVRSQEEYSAGHAQGSLHLPLHLIPVLAAEKLPKDRPLLLCCASGARSAMAMEYLRPLGYAAHNLGAWMAHPDFS